MTQERDPITESSRDKFFDVIGTISADYREHVGRSLDKIKGEYPVEYNDSEKFYTALKDDGLDEYDTSEILSQYRASSGQDEVGKAMRASPSWGMYREMCVKYDQFGAVDEHTLRREIFQTSVFLRAELDGPSMVESLKEIYPL